MLLVDEFLKEFADITLDFVNKTIDIQTDLKLMRIVNNS